MAYYEPGRYRCQVVAQGFGRSQKKQTPYFYLEVQPTHRVKPDDEHEVEGYTRRIEFWLTDKTIDFVSDQLRDLGFAGESFEDLNPDREGHHSFAGQEIVARCNHSTNPTSGKVYDSFSLATSNGSAPAENDCSVTKELDGMFGAALRATAEQAAKNAPIAKEGAAATTATAEDLPF